MTRPSGYPIPTAATRPAAIRHKLSPACAAISPEKMRPNRSKTFNGLGTIGASIITATPCHKMSNTTAAMAAVSNRLSHPGSILVYFLMFIYIMKLPSLSIHAICCSSQEIPPHRVLSCIQTMDYQFVQVSFHHEQTAPLSSVLSKSLRLRNV